MHLWLGLASQAWENVLIAFVVGLCVFLVFREFFTWYWKLNRIVDLLESIDQKLGRDQDAA